MIHSFDDLTDQHEPSESEDDDEQQLLQWVTGWTAALPVRCNSQNRFSISLITFHHLEL